MCDVTVPPPAAPGGAQGVLNHGIIVNMFLNVPHDKVYVKRVRLDDAFYMLLIVLISTSL